jgi:hypothetical protein
MRLLLIILGASLLAGCGAKTNGPLALYFVGSSRFTTGNKTNVGPGDSLATNLYALASDNNALRHFQVTVAYAPEREPFVYTIPLSSRANSRKADSVVVFIDSTFTANDFLYTPVFGVRTTAGTERWTFTATDKDNNTSSRSFVLSVRRSDSLTVYNDYTLRLRVPAAGVAARRFIDLKSGIALPAYSVLGNASIPSAKLPTSLQRLTDLIVLPDGLRLVSPDSASKYSKLNDTRWLVANRSRTRFRLTNLTPTDFTSAQDTVAIQNQFTGTGRAYLPTLARNQVYAFQASRPTGRPVYGLLLVRDIPNSTSTAGLQLDVRVAKQRRPLN